MILLGVYCYNIQKFNGLFNKMNNIKLLPALLSFAEVANQQSFTGAAKQLGMSKSAVSQQVKRLELHIGQQLLSRHTRGMSLTTAGAKLLGRCELLQDQVNLAFAELSANQEEPSGTFALTIPHSCERDIVIPALNQLCIEFPRLKPKLVVSDEPMDLIQAKMDVSIYGGELKDSNYRALPIGSAREILCATPAYVLKNGPIEKLPQLSNIQWISAPWQNTQRALYDTRAESEKINLNVDVFASSNTLPSAVDLVMHHMGVALFPEFTVQSQLASGQMIRVLPSYQGRQWPFYLVHRFQGEKPIHITRFYQLVKHFFVKAKAA